MWEVWANWLSPKALKICPKSNKLAYLVTLVTSMAEAEEHLVTNQGVIVCHLWLCIFVFGLSIDLQQKNVFFAGIKPWVAPRFDNVL